jgi:tritrans,polycis-undecaprenyl-diphosphate synthase [geranylgeranyl-diphosphate specific]
MKQYKTPTHISIILDGNRRYAIKKGLKPWQGHKFGGKKVEELLKWCNELGIKELTLYSFSVDNFNRPEREKRVLFNLFLENVKKLKNDERLSKYGIRVRFIGRLRMFPKEIQNEMNEVMEKTKDNSKFKLNLAMAYSSKAEITDSIKKILNKLKNQDIKIDDIDENAVNDNLYLSDSPDILIRPGGEKRISDFLLWQLAYSELFFVDKLWPEFTKEDFVGIIEEYKKRERRYGK